MTLTSSCRLAPALLLALAGLVRAEVASGPQGATLSVYDAGYALVSENRRVALTRGDNEIVIRQLPAALDPATVSLSPLAAGVDLRPLDVRFEHDAAAVDRLFERYVGRPLTVVDAEGAREGTLLAAPGRNEQYLLLAQAEGATRAVQREAIREVVFPRAAAGAFLEPTLVWRAASGQDGLQNLRLNYLAHGLVWSAHHEITVAVDGQRARFDTRVRVANQSGGSFHEARIRLVGTARGAATGGGSSTELRYAYGGSEPVPASQAAGLAPARHYELGRPLTLRAGETSYVPLNLAEAVAVSRFHVYDGVKFDRFPRNPRTDWNLGTVCQNAVETHLEFTNAKGEGLGLDLPPGRLRILQQRADGGLDFLGEDALAATLSGAVGHVRVGPARGLQGERAHRLRGAAPVA